MVSDRLRDTRSISPTRRANSPFDNDVRTSASIASRRIWKSSMSSESASPGLPCDHVAACSRTSSGMSCRLSKNVAISAGVRAGKKNGTARDRIVGSSKYGFSEVRMIVSPSAGSSSVFSRAFAASGVVRSACSMMNTRWRPSDARRRAALRSASACAIPMFCIGPSGGNIKTSVYSAMISGDSLRFAATNLLRSASRA